MVKDCECSAEWDAMVGKDFFEYACERHAFRGIYRENYFEFLVLPWSWKVSLTHVAVDIIKSASYWPLFCLTVPIRKKVITFVVTKCYQM